MTVLPLYTSPPDPDAWHQVTAPGGYEWWNFDAEDDTGDLQIVAIFSHGFVFHPGYLRQYTAYVRRPTRRAPPTPSDYPCAYFVVYEKGRIAARFMSQFTVDAFLAATDRTDVRIGPNTAARRPGGEIELSLRGTPWRMTWQGPKLQSDDTLSAELTFRPRISGPAMEQIFLSRQLSGADHHWVIADPICGVSGTISMGAEGSRRQIRFSGRGYHDHNYGTAPIGRGLKRWVWGRAIGGDRMYGFHFARALDRELPDEIGLVRADAGGRHEVAVAATEIDWTGRTALGLAYPRRIVFPPFLELSGPRVIDAAPFYLRLMYDARLDGGIATTAFCEVAYPHRLRWPVLGRMIEMSIDRK